ncbi:MAG: hypothetical protein ABR947_09395 [Solirubrobacteraceae bacterium]|jgi:hypothetical protein
MSDMTSDTNSSQSGRRRRPSTGWAALIGGVLLLAFAANASAAGNPKNNIAVGPLPAACSSTPRSGTCQHAMVVALDRAHAALGLGPYLLPADFYSLKGTEQLLVLCNLDRLAYGLPPVTGLSPVLNAVAATGVTADADPDPSALLSSLSSFGWSSNWAGGYGNALEAYYAWMYSDGWAGRQTSNLDCTSPTSSGCWGHRQDVLAFSQPGLLSMGASVSRDSQGQIGYAITLVWTPQTNWTSYSYSWASAQADGAGSTLVADSRR